VIANIATQKTKHPIVSGLGLAAAIAPFTATSAAEMKGRA
jgi:hypothetical protein